ncbi:MAG TPA: hypothetical protein VFN66_00330 [Burkholderiales bacterium]|nr:hypothetical protein [Burkholderiales bacterium]
MKSKAYLVGLVIFLLAGSMSPAMAMVHAIPTGGATDNQKNKVKKKPSEVTPSSYQKSKIIPLTIPAVKQSR